MRRYLLAHDLGTTGNKATLFDHSGRLVAACTSSYGTTYEKENRAEQNPHDWWRAVCETSRRLLHKVDKRDIGVVCLSGQMMGCVCVDRAGEPLRNSIIYSDQRATKEAGTLMAAIGADELYRISGHRISASYSIEKLMWVKAHERSVYRSTHRMLNAKDYINLKLTGKFYTDYNDASGTNCFDIREKEWAGKVLDLAEVEPGKLPEAKGSTFVAGGVTRGAAEETGLAFDTPVVVGAGDGGCATVGVGCVKEGVSYNYLGSSSWISTATREPVFDKGMRTFTWVHPVAGLYQPCGTVQTAGSSLGWVADELYARMQTGARGAAGSDPTPQVRKASKGVQDVEDSVFEWLTKEAGVAPPGANGVIFLPYLLGERSPRWNPDAKGAWIGLKLSNTRSDLVRAVLEGVAMNLEIVLSVLRAYVPIHELTMIGGGAQSEVWRRILADVYGLRILIPEYLEEATSMGAAIIGGVGTGYFDFEEGARRFVRIRSTEEPDTETSRVYDKIKPVFDECYSALEPMMSKL